VLSNRRALVLNQNYEPLNVCAGRRAFVLVHNGKAEVLEAADQPIHGVDRSFTLPSVIRLHQAVRVARCSRETSIAASTAAGAGTS
jgi:hypothetical protein